MRHREPKPREGAPGAVLRLVSPHAARLHDHLARLDARERQLRLGRHVEASAIRAYCNRPRTQKALIIGGFVDGQLVASGELVGLPDIPARGDGGASIAELVVAVEPTYRSAGLASQVCRHLIQHAAQRRAPLIRMTYHPDNVAMMRLAAQFGAMHYRVGDMLRAELCTGWLGEELAPILIEDSPGFRPISLH